MKRKIDTINLLPSADRLNLSQQKLVKRLNTFAMVLVVLTMIFVGGIFGYQFWLKERKNNLINDKRKLNQSLSQFDLQLSLQQNLRYRLKLVSQLLSDRTNTVEDLTDVDDVLPSGAVVERLDVQGKSIDISGKLTELKQVAELERKISEIRKKGSYKEINLGALNKRNEGWPFEIKVVKK